MKLIVTQFVSPEYVGPSPYKLISSPFINIVSLGISKVNLERTKLKKDENSRNTNIVIVGTIAEGGLRGNKVVVNSSFLDKDEFCVFDEKDDKIQYKSY